MSEREHGFVTTRSRYAPVKWREVRAYLGSVDEAYKKLTLPIGATILSALAQPEDVRVGREKPLVLANLNSTKIPEIEDDTHLQDVFLNMPGVHVVVADSGIERIHYDATVTSALGFHTLCFARSRVHPMDNVDGEMRLIYSMTSSPSKPLT